MCLHGSGYWRNPGLSGVGHELQQRPWVLGLGKIVYLPVQLVQYLNIEHTPPHPSPNLPGRNVGQRWATPPWDGVLGSLFPV